MTCIVGLVEGGKVWIGGDSRASAACQRYLLTDVEQKVFKRGEMVFGVTGPPRAVQIFKHVVEISEHSDGVETFAYLVTVLAPAIRRAIQEHDGLKINDPHNGWELLLGYRGTLHSICHDLSVSYLPIYGAVGCGREYAMGSLHTTHRDPAGVVRFSPHDRLAAALEAAAEHDIHVAAPFVIECAA